MHTSALVAETVIYPRAVITNDTTKQAGLIGSLFKSGAKQGDSGGTSGGSTEEQKMPAGGETEAYTMQQGQRVLSEGLKDFPLYIDGIDFSGEEAKKIVIKRLKKDNVHVSVPIVTYLPLKLDDLPNSHF